MKPQLAIWSSYYVDLSPEDAISELIKYGITASELSDEHAAMLLQRGEPREVGRTFANFLQERNFTMTQGHLWLQCHLCQEGAVDILCRWLELFDAIGIQNAVLHLDGMGQNRLMTPEEKYALNLEKLLMLQDYMIAHQLSVRICIENLRSFAFHIDQLMAVVNQLSEAHFGICLDTGHLNLCEDKNQYNFIQKAGHRLYALHIADNEGERDQHLMPFGKGCVDFSAVVKGLSECHYTGLFNLEIPGERLAPLPVRGYKLQYIRQCYEYLFQDYPDASQKETS